MPSGWTLLELATVQGKLREFVRWVDSIGFEAIEVSEGTVELGAGIKAGRYDVQRLVYWHIAKLFWNETFSFEANNHVNFDWRCKLVCQWLRVC